MQGMFKLTNSIPRQVCEIHVRTLGCLSAERDTEGYTGLSREIWD